jgi:hypothetical protein
MEKKKMLSINLSGITFLKDETKTALINDLFSVGDECRVVQLNDMTKKYDGDFSIRCKGHHIGWIPQLGTIMRYLNKANLAKDHLQYKRQDERYNIVDICRGNIVTDIHINKLEPKCEIAQILFKSDKGFHDFGEKQKERSIACVSVVFKYPYP